MREIVLFIFTLIFISGCTIKPEVKESQSAQLLIKTPIIKISDFALIKTHSSSKRVYVLNAGQKVLDILISDKICLNGPCFEKLNFNNRFFQRTHYENIFEEILNLEPIYDSKNLIKTKNGFMQNIEFNNELISYEKINSGIRYQDRAKNILIIIDFKGDK